MIRSARKRFIGILVSLCVLIALIPAALVLTSANGASTNPRIPNVLYPNGERTVNDLGSIHPDHLDPTKTSGSDYRGPAANITFPSGQVTDAWGMGVDVVWGKFFMVDGIVSATSYNYGGWMPAQGAQWSFNANDANSKNMIFELHQMYYIDQVSLYAAAEENLNRIFFPQEYKIYTSDNGSDWVLQAHVNHESRFGPNPGEGETVNFDNGAVHTKWVRIEFLRNDTDPEHPNDKAIALGEIRISGFANDPNADYPETPCTPNPNDFNVLYPDGERTVNDLGLIHPDHLDPSKTSGSAYRGPAANITFPSRQVSDAWGMGVDVVWGKFFMVDGIAATSSYNYGGWMPAQGAQWGFDKDDQSTKDMIFELHNEYIIDGISLYAAVEDNVERRFYPQEFKVYTSDNGTDWTLQVYKNYKTQFRPEPGAENRYNFAAPVRTKWVRIEFLRNDIDPTHPNDKAIALGEIRIWGVNVSQGETTTTTTQQTTTTTTTRPEVPKGIVNLNYPYGHPYANLIESGNHIPEQYGPAKPNATIIYPTGMINVGWDWHQDYLFDGFTFFEVEGVQLYPWYDNPSYKRALGAQWGFDPGVQGDTLIIEYPEAYKMTGYSFFAAIHPFDVPSEIDPDRFFFPQEWRVYTSETGEDGSWQEVSYMSYEEDFIPEMGEEIRIDFEEPVIAKFIKFEFIRAHEAANGDYNIALSEIAVWGEIDSDDDTTPTTTAANGTIPTSANTGTTGPKNDDSPNAPSTGENNAMLILINTLLLVTAVTLAVMTKKKNPADIQ